MLGETSDVAVGATVAHAPIQRGDAFEGGAGRTLRGLLVGCVEHDPYGKPHVDLGVFESVGARRNGPGEREHERDQKLKWLQLSPAVNLSPRCGFAVRPC